jgi:hypothetical protein
MVSGETATPIGSAFEQGMVPAKHRKEMELCLPESVITATVAKR